MIQLLVILPVPNLETTIEIAEIQLSHVPIAVVAHLIHQVPLNRYELFIFFFFQLILLISSLHSFSFSYLPIYATISKDETGVKSERNLEKNAFF